MSQLTALLLTLVIELFVCLALKSAVLPKDIRWQRLAAVCLTASLLTHPVAWWLNQAGSGCIGPWARVGLIEAVVVVAEAGIYIGLAPMMPRRAFGLSLVANSTSFGLGLLILAQL
jgi:hypothetical protein